ncbi:MAG: hypothetical protein KF841_05225 [Phycisphaerae bacterium]|nr:hypothetical protein [Phycisphaerae bacterium]
MAATIQNDSVHPTGDSTDQNNAPVASRDSALTQAENQYDRPQDDAIIQRTAIRGQREAIARYRQSLTHALGRDVSLDEAAKMWIPAFAAQWREEFEAAIAFARAPISFPPLLDLAATTDQ